MMNRRDILKGLGALVVTVAHPVVNAIERVPLLGPAITPKLREKIWNMSGDWSISVWLKPDGKIAWKHFVSTYDAKTHHQQEYIDGWLTTKIQYPPIHSVGKEAGPISDIAVWNRPLVQEEVNTLFSLDKIDTLYNEGKGEKE